jgi:hypothetical protein
MGGKKGKGRKGKGRKGKGRKEGKEEGNVKCYGSTSPVVSGESRSCLSAQAPGRDL